MNDHATFRLIDVVKRYGATPAVEAVSLDVPARRAVALIGPSGCGKSTLLRLLIGLIAPDRGTVEFEGAPIGSTVLPRLRERVGYVIQEGGLFPHLSAFDNVALKARDLGRDRAWIELRVAELAKLAQLPDTLLDRHPAELSGGQRQRVGLMRALMLDPEALLLDEPLGALDPMVRARLQGLLREIFRTLEKTVVLVTHDMAEAAFLCDHIVLMRDGRIVQQGTLRELLERPADPFVVAFIRAQRPALEVEAR